jgi:methionine-rich copper-binding protein CopC
MRRLLVAALLALAPAAALAHAQLVRAVPPVGATVRSAPPEIVLSFSEPVEAALSTLELHDAGGKTLESGPPRLGGDGRQLAIAIGTLAPGTYKVVWKVTSIDTHRTEGDFTFRVAP